VNDLALPPLSIYLHFPWCVRKCPYCDFNSHTLRDELPEARYIDALIADLTAQAARVPGRQIVSIFMGGGTPSLFSPAALGRLLDVMRGMFTMVPGTEITLEANPATVERGRFSEYRSAGINRVSLGAQSFNDETLQGLGRVHKSADVYRAADELHASGLTNFNIDLMFALPQQTLAAALADLTTALTLRPAHLSQYQLTLEPGTLFAANPPPLPDDDDAWCMQSESHGLLAAHGFEQYEVSAFARSGRQCVHNLNYWNFGDYLGAGAGAHGKLSRLATIEERASGGALVIERSTHLREPRRYFAAASGGPEWRQVPRQDLPFEFMMNALRLNAGFHASVYESRTAQPLTHVIAVLDLLARQNLLTRDGEAWRASDRGRPFLNELVQRFLPVQNSQGGAHS
jgi:putative oxygen-independent coproporphyrinogen III oxidase